MFLVSNEEKDYFYKVSQVSKGKTSKGKPYTFISISNKQRDSDTWDNGKLMYWDDAVVEKGDFVAFCNVSGVEQYSFQPSGSLKNYSGVNISTTKIKIKKPQQEDEKSKKKQSSQPTVESPKEQKSYQPIEDDTLPF